jgi:hypothetical protein
MFRAAIVEHGVKEMRAYASHPAARVSIGLEMTVDRRWCPDRSV